MAMSFTTTFPFEPSFFQRAIFASGSTFSLYKIATEFGIPDNSPDPIGELRTRVREHLSNPAIAGALAQEDRNVLRSFIGGKVVLNTSEIEPPIVKLLRIIRQSPSRAHPEPIPHQPSPAARTVTAGPLTPLEQYLPPDNSQIEASGLTTKSIEELIQNDRIVKFTDEGNPYLAMRGQPNLTEQDYFDCLQILKHQLGTFHDMLVNLHQEGADVETLVAEGGQFMDTLVQAHASLTMRRMSLLRTWLEIAEEQLSRLHHQFEDVARSIDKSLAPIRTAVTTDDSKVTTQMQAIPETFPDEKRDTSHGHRLPVNLKIKFKSATLEMFIERYAVDISHGGIFIRTKDPLKVGTTLRFEFQLNDQTPLIAGEGTVVWTRSSDEAGEDEAPGMGIRFDRLKEGSQDILDKILAAKAQKISP
jgi:uncharacterized protein (TIGR02266 family)